MANLRKYAAEQDKDLLGSLRDMTNGALAADEGDAERIVGAKRVGASYEAGLALIESASGLEGTALLDKVTELVTSQEGATAPGIVSALCLGEQDNSAAAMAESASAAACWRPASMPQAPPWWSPTTESRGFRRRC